MKYAEDINDLHNIYDNWSRTDNEQYKKDYMRIFSLKLRYLQSRYELEKELESFEEKLKEMRNYKNFSRKRKYDDI